MPTFTKVVEIVRSAKEKRLKGETRGRNTRLSIEDQVLLCFMYLKSYTTYFYLGTIFGIHECNACRISKKIENILISSRIFSLPNKKELLQENLEEIIVDTTEIQVSRPKKKQKRKYSGKAKMHTQKTQITIAKIGGKHKIMRTVFAEGKKHDKKLYDDGKVSTNKKAQKLMDSGYQWVQHNSENVVLPYKGSKNNKLTKEQKKHNRELSKKRIKVENKISEIKVFEILDERYRSPKANRFWLRFNLICGIVNHNVCGYLTSRPFH